MFIDVVTIMDQSPFNPTLKQKPTHLKPDTTNRKNGYIFVVILNVCWMFCLMHNVSMRNELNSTYEIALTEGPQISADIINAQYTVETLVMAVLAGSIFSLLVGFFTGYFCGRRCHKDEDDNLPYPDTEYEYFEQRQNVNR